MFGLRQTLSIEIKQDCLRLNLTFQDQQCAVKAFMQDMKRHGNVPTAITIGQLESHAKIQIVLPNTSEKRDGFLRPHQTTRSLKTCVWLNQSTSNKRLAKPNELRLIRGDR